ncbi:MAG: glycosyltransferase [Crocinitomicaceae bacterium]|nr:glycosyltransferase [Crocinitomicaceae bacterium]MBK8925263.1 glycosyltransferase [Crocinitomicaceae bacterium]
MKEGILIVSYTFPPNPAIGGKRWYKFAQEFFNKGFDVHVISSEKSNVHFAKNDSDIQNFKMYYLKDNYPDWFFQRQENLLQRIRYKLFQYYLLIKSKGTIFDKSLFLQHEAQHIVRQVIIKNNIQLVIVTSPPFYLSSFVSQLKREIDFKLICDLRDPWTWGESYGYKNLSTQRLSHDKNLEQNVVFNCDYIISPSHSIVHHLKNFYPAHQNKIFHIPHGVDNSIVSRSARKNDKLKTGLKFIYAGTLYAEYDKFLEILCKSVRGFSKERLEQFSFDIYALNSNDQYKQIVDKWMLNEKICFHEPISEKQLIEKFNEYDGSIIFFPTKYKNFLSTKFIELIALRIPIVYVGEHGDVATFLESKKLGFHLELNELETELEQTISCIMDNYNVNFDISDFHFSALTDKILEMSKRDMNHDF